LGDDVTWISADRTGSGVVRGRLLEFRSAAAHQEEIGLDLLPLAVEHQFEAVSQQGLPHIGGSRSPEVPGGNVAAMSYVSESSHAGPEIGN
jgi:hypothetical protein